jgi:hypothetical protein
LLCAAGRVNLCGRHINRGGRLLFLFYLLIELNKALQSTILCAPKKQLLATFNVNLRTYVEPIMARNTLCFPWSIHLQLGRACSSPGNAGFHKLSLFSSFSSFYHLLSIYCNKQEHIRPKHQSNMNSACSPIDNIGLPHTQLLGKNACKKQPKKQTHASQSSLAPLCTPALLLYLG